MHLNKSNVFNLSLLFICVIVISCNHSGKNEKTVKQNDTAKLEEKVKGDIKDVIQFAFDHGARIDDSLKLKLVSATEKFYNAHDYNPVWSKEKNGSQWLIHWWSF